MSEPKTTPGPRAWTHMLSVYFGLMLAGTSAGFAAHALGLPARRAAWFGIDAGIFLTGLTLIVLAIGAAVEVQRQREAAENGKAPAQ